MHELNLKAPVKIALSILFTALILLIGGYTPRTLFYNFIVLYILAFSIYFLLMNAKISLRDIFIVGVLSRLSLLFFLPELSNDFYRFLWDGELLLQGISPYGFKPNELISYGQFLSNDYYLSLYHGMGELSQSNYSCYPVLNQFIFGFCTLFSDNILVNTAIMKGVIVLADIGTLWIGTKVLDLLNLSQKRIGWYFLNPLIILEFSGNLHFEGVMLFFIITAIYFIIKNNWIMGGLFLAFAVQIKLIPLLFIPFVYKKLKWQRAVGFTAVTLVAVLLMSQILINTSNFSHFMASIELYFNKFQFNASIFNWINTLYSQHIGWDTTAIVGPKLSKIAMTGICLLAILRAYRKPVDIFANLVFALTIYYGFATTVHPWYISLILLFSIFTNYRFGILWTLFIAASYLAYSDPNFIENKVLNTILYIGLFGYMAYEIYLHWQAKAFGLQIKDFFSNSLKD